MRLQRAGPLSYRGEIDGLRAIAVWAVVLFHVDVPLCTGGFVGVDVFFVISGYLIAAKIFAQLEHDDFTLRDFYERRAKRILPALFLVLAATTVGAAMILPAAALKDYSNAGLATEGFFANVYFSLHTGYFDADVTTRPLMHAWSLAVEEQFYLVFPLLFLAAHRWRPKASWILFGLLAAASLGWSAIAAGPAHYFDSFARGWEFLLGVLLATVPLPALGERTANAASALGLGAIGLAVVGFSRETTFPGLAALLPCLGAALVLWGTEHPNASVRRWLERPLLRWNGFISYSLYLWHWPVLVLAAEYAGPPLGVAARIGCVALAVVLAAISTHCLERPIRTSTRTKTVFAGLAVCAVVLAGALFWLRSRPTPSWHAPGETASEQLEAALARMHEGRLELQDRRNTNRRHLGKYGAPLRFVLWGDSHAFALAETIDDIADEAGVRGYLAGLQGCPPLVGVQIGQSPRCRRKTAGFLAEIKKRPSIHTVILSARWTLAAEGMTPPGERPVRRWPLVRAGGAGTETQLELFSDSLASTIAQLRRQGIHVVLVGPVPEQADNASGAVARAAKHGRALPSPVLRRDFFARSGSAVSVLRKLARRRGVTALWPHETLCDRECDYFRDGKLLYVDNNHLSKDGASLLANALRLVVQRTKPPGKR